MPTASDYRDRITQYDTPDLVTLWAQIQQRDTPDWDPGKALEYLVIRAFELEGAAVTYPFSVRMGNAIVEQIDGAVYSDHLSCLVECKDQESNITIDPVAKLRNQLLRRPSGVIGLVFSSSSFTESTLILAQYSANQAILLWTKDDLSYALTQQKMRESLILKYRYCIERGLPLCTIHPGDFL